MMTSKPSIAVVHLLWQGTDCRHFREFLVSFDANPAGRDHDLLLLFKGCTEEQKAERLDIVSPRPFQALDVPDGPVDIADYYQAAEQTDYALYCFTNSYSVIRAPNWLDKLAKALESNPSAGVVSPSGSWEQTGPDTPFPNYHLRSNGFLIRRDLFLTLNRGDLSTKSGGGAFEAGPNSMTRQILAKGLEPLVVDKDGKAWKKEGWQDSKTFRSGGQSGLMIADNRARAYEEGDAVIKTYLETMAWTDKDPGPNPFKRDKLSYKYKKMLHSIGGASKKRFPG